jgi:hypothetical protein
MFKRYLLISLWLILLEVTIAQQEDRRFLEEERRLELEKIAEYSQDLLYDYGG